MCHWGWTIILSTFVRCSGGEAASCGDVIIFVLWEVILDFFDQGEACGERSRSRGDGGLREEAVGISHVWGWHIQWGKVKVGAMQWRPGKNKLLKIQGRSAGCGLWSGYRWVFRAIQAYQWILFLFKIMRHQLIYSPVLLVLGSGESRPSTGGPSSFPLGGCGGGGGESWQFWSPPCSVPPPTGPSSLLKYFCSQEGTILLTVSVTRLMRPDCCWWKDMKRTRRIKCLKMTPCGFWIWILFTDRIYQFFITILRFSGAKKQLIGRRQHWWK